jgi:hypothetical protein
MKKRKVPTDSKPEPIATPHQYPVLGLIAKSRWLLRSTVLLFLLLTAHCSLLLARARPPFAKARLFRPLAIQLA